MKFGRVAIAGLLLVAFAAASVAAASYEGENEIVLDVADAAGRQLLREAEPNDDRKVTCRRSGGKKICRVTCYKRVCRRSAGKVLCRKAKIACKVVKKAAKKVDDNPHPEDGPNHTRKLQSVDDAEVIEADTGRQLLVSKLYDDKRVLCHMSKGKKSCRTVCRKRKCFKVGRKSYCRMATVSCFKLAGRSPSPSPSPAGRSPSPSPSPQPGTSPSPSGSDD